MKNFKALLFFLFINLFSIPLFSQYKLPIIDMHMHIGAPLDLPAGAPGLSLNFGAGRYVTTLTMKKINI